MESDYEEEFEWKGRLYTVKELADIAGINERTMSHRLDCYKTMEAVMAVEPMRNGKVKKNGNKSKENVSKMKGKFKLWLYEGAYCSIRQIALLTGIPRNTLWQRLRKFGNVDEAVNCPYNRKAKNNISAMLEAGGISKDTFYKAVKEGVTLGEFFGVKR